MKYSIMTFILSVFLFSQSFCQEKKSVSSNAETVPGDEGNWVLVIHGGAGGSSRGSISPETQQVYIDSLSNALAVGAGILREGGSALDAVEAVVAWMEDCPLFNAGRGAVLTLDGVAELDASIMDGATGKAGAVACVTTVRNPVKAARMVMDSSKHVLLVSDGAEKFAAVHKLALVTNSYFITPDTKEKWEKSKSGTVGCVALDSRGNLAAATSTGGLMNKAHGRVGDSPLIGAGCYARNNTCAVSATGQGEYFIRNVVAYDLSALMEYRGMPLEEAARYLILEKLKQQGGSGGLIAVDREGNIAMPFNTHLMFRGSIRSQGEPEIAIY